MPLDFVGLLTVSEKIRPDDLEVLSGLIFGLNGGLRAGGYSQRGQVENRRRTLPMTLPAPRSSSGLPGEVPTVSPPIPLQAGRRMQARGHFPQSPGTGFCVP